MQAIQRRWNPKEATIALNNVEDVALHEDAKKKVKGFLKNKGFSEISSKKVHRLPIFLIFNLKGDNIRTKKQLFIFTKNKIDGLILRKMRTKENKIKLQDSANIVGRNLFISIKDFKILKEI